MDFLFFKPRRWGKRSAVQPQTICSEVPKAGTGKGNEKSWETELIAWRTT